MWILGLKGLNCFLPSIATDGKDGHGLKLEKLRLAQLFQVLMLWLAAKLTKNLFWVALPDVVFMISSP